MRPVSILIAAAVAVALYAVVLERDRLLQLAGAGPPVAETGQTDAQGGEGAGAPGAGARTAATGGEAVPRVIAVRSQAREVATTITLRGETEASRSLALQAETTGRIISEPIPKGTRITAGDVLCRIDPGTRQAQLAEAEARLAEARIGDTAAARLAEGGFGSETRTLGAKAALQAAQAAVDSARTEIARLTITAPFGGVLVEDTAELGTLMQPGALCATIMQLDPIRIRAFMPETLVEEVAQGAAAEVSLPGGRVLPAEVTFVASTSDADTRTFRIDLTAANPDRAIRDGQSAGVTIQSRGIEAHLVPASALTLDDDGRMGLRVVDDAGRVGFVPVDLVRDTAEGVYVTGLPETARVIVAGQDFVRAGVTVEAVLREPDA